MKMKKIIFGCVLLLSPLIFIAGETDIGDGENEVKDVITVSSSEPWAVIYCRTGDKELDELFNERLFFCVRNEGESDLLLFGVRYGGVYPAISLTKNDKVIKLSISKDNKVVWDGEVGGGFTYEARMINLGDIFGDKDVLSHSNIAISKISATVK